MFVKTQGAGFVEDPEPSIENSRCAACVLENCPFVEKFPVSQRPLGKE